MRPQRSAWLVCVPLTAVGGLFAHVLGYALAAPTGSAGHAAAAHGYLAYWRLFVAACLTLILLGLAVAVVQTLNGRQLRAPLWLFALLPPLGFVVQEYLERAIGGGSVAGLPLEPVFALGLVLQVPFAFLAFVIARALLSLAASVVRVLCDERSRLVAVLPPFMPAVAAGTRRLPPLALGYAERGPPPSLR